MQQHPEVVDLGDMRARLEAQENARAIEEGERAKGRLAEWERGMQRAFKGIYSRPQRHSMLKSALARHERELEAQ